METTKQIDGRAYMQLRACYQERRLTKHQYKTLRGHVLVGDGDAALKGLKKILDGRNKR